jgi:hypothetical protein
VGSGEILAVGTVPRETVPADLETAGASEIAIVTVPHPAASHVSTIT